eukprot:COSAG01_NODE_32107_length_586_cov_1.006160_1_plen_55_part_01
MVRLFLAAAALLSMAGSVHGQLNVYQGNTNPWQINNPPSPSTSPGRCEVMMDHFI